MWGRELIWPANCTYALQDQEETCRLEAFNKQNSAKCQLYEIPPKYSWWLKSCTSWYGKYFIIYSVLYMLGVAGQNWTKVQNDAKNCVGQDISENTQKFGRSQNSRHQKPPSRRHPSSSILPLHGWHKLYRPCSTVKGSPAPWPKKRCRHSWVFFSAVWKKCPVFFRIVAFWRNNLSYPKCEEK